ncbi:unnamed protein product [Rotaria sp. Silwood1]|nr:unnamed protein product [Rotaria sp. Silwood1]CAF1303423.1 unnamed protein product [Rotaria sp. Silwood1]
MDRFTLVFIAAAVVGLLYRGDNQMMADAATAEEAKACSSCLCWSSGWGSCNDGGCTKSGGYCVNYGRPPNNDCQCIPIGKYKLHFKN